MRRKKTEEEKIIDEIVSLLTDEIRSKQERVLKKLGKQLNQSDYTFQQFNGRFGGKNNTYVDSVRTQFLDFDDFYAQWIKGLVDKYEEDKKYQINTYGRTYEEKASFVNLRLLKDPEIESLVRIFLERNFYKKLNERTRSKPNESLWSIWFGYKLIYGLIIAPVKRNDIWTNDRSEIRKAEYSYWTVGHVLKEGLIDPELDEPIKFKTLDELCLFYQSVLKRISNSTYEQKFSDLYIEYLKSSPNPEEEPFLIPEVRYDGLTRDHVHRLDFTILNPYTFEFTGIEISPTSTHLTVKRLKEEEQKINIALKKQWEKEVGKRNDYFSKFGITTLTFTDSHLIDLNACFEGVKKCLSARPTEKVVLKEQMNRLKNA